MSEALSLLTHNAALAAGRWLTVAQLAQATGLAKRTISWNCSHGDLRNSHRWMDQDGSHVIEINLDAPACPQRYRDAARDHAESSEHGQAHALTQKQLTRATKLAALLEEIETLLAADTSGKPEKDRIAAFLAGKRAFDASIPSVRSYYRLRSRWLAGGRRLLAIADGRATTGGGVKKAFDEEAFTFFCALYLTQEARQATVCYDKLQEAAKLKAWEVPSLATVLRTLSERIPKDRQIHLRQGDKAKRDRAEMYQIRDWSQMQANEFWVSDHCQLDVIGIDDLPGRARTHRPARMWLTTWMDEATRFIVGWRVHRGPNAAQVLASFYSGIIRHGLPDNIRIDNGKDYRCQRFAGGRSWREEISRVEVDPEALRPILYDLGITPHYAQPYNARAKIIEPWHRHCIKEQFSKWVPGYCGGSTEEKPEQLAEIVKHWEKTGQGLMNWTKLVELLAQVIDGYHARTHSGLESAGGPAFVRQQKLAEISLRLPDERTAALFLEERVVSCHAGGFLMLDDAHYGQGNLALIQRQGEKLRVRLDEQNAGRVYVFDLSGRFITIAENAGRIAANATREDVALSLKAKAQHKKLAAAYADSCAIIGAVDPVTAIALQSTRGALQALPAGDPDAPLEPNFKPDFTARADDGTRLPKPLAARPAPQASPAPEPNDTQVAQRTDSAGQSSGPPLSRDDIWALLDS